jgi:type I restriction enzyme, S subunit
VNPLRATDARPIQGWKSVPLGELLLELRNGLVAEQAKSPPGIPITRIETISYGVVDLDRVRYVRDVAPEKLKNFWLKKGDLLFSHINSDLHLGKTAVVMSEKPLLHGMNLLLLRPDPHQLKSKFLHHWLDHCRRMGKFMAIAQHAVNQSSLNQKKISSLEIPLPPIGTQEEIVAEIEKQFSRLDEAVANLKRVKANLKRYKASVFHEIFHASPNATLGELIEVGPQNGLYLPKSMYGSGVPILRIDDYQTAWLRARGELRLVAATTEQIATWALHEGDLVINRVNSMTHLGKCVVVPLWLEGSVFESNMMRLRLNERTLPKYIEYYLASEIGRKRLTQNAKWAVNQASINQKDVRGTPVFVPEISVQKRVVAAIDRQFSIIRGVDLQADANLKHADRMRHAILSAMFKSIPTDVL